MAEAREAMHGMTQEEIIANHCDIIWMSNYFIDECPDELKKEGLSFLETIAAYKLAFAMNDEEPPHTDMSTFGHGHYNDEYMPNWAFSFISIIPNEKHNAWHFIFTELHKFKFCQDMDIPFEMAKGQDFNDRMQFIQSGLYLN